MVPFRLPGRDPGDDRQQVARRSIRADLRLVQDFSQISSAVSQKMHPKQTDSQTKRVRQTNKLSTITKIVNIMYSCQKQEIRSAELGFCPMQFFSFLITWRSSSWKSAADKLSWKSDDCYCASAHRCAILIYQFCVSVRPSVCSSVCPWRSGMMKTA